MTDGSNNNSGWGESPWGLDPWGGFQPVGFPDINWSFERPDDNDPPGADLWAFNILGVGFYTATFGLDDEEAETWYIPGFHFVLGSAVFVADFTLGDGSKSTAEDFRSGWKNTVFNKTLPEDSPIAEFNDEQSEEWTGRLNLAEEEPSEDPPESERLWKSYRSAFGRVRKSFIGESIELANRSVFGIDLVDTTTDNPEAVHVERGIDEGGYSADDLVEFFNDWFGEVFALNGFVASASGEWLIIEAPETANKYAVFSTPEDSIDNNAWATIGMANGGEFRINLHSFSENGVFGQMVSPPDPQDSETFGEHWGQSEYILDNEDPEPFDFETNGETAEFNSECEAVEAEGSENFWPECWLENLDPLTGEAIII